MQAASLMSNTCTPIHPQYFLIYLQWRTRGLGPGHFLGSQALTARPPKEWGQLSGWPSAVSQFLATEPNWQEQAEAFAQVLGRERIRLVTYSDPAYPRAFRQLYRAPLVLSYLGSETWLQGEHLAVVGSRRLTEDSRRWLERHLRKVLADQPPVVLSGGARGTDQLAHSLCLRQGVPTVCFLPSGLLNPYPTELLDWADPIVSAGGAMVSAFAPWERMAKQNFPARNHLIASLARVVLAVDPCRRSGTMITARAAMDYGKTVAILPSHPSQAQGLGGLDLIYDGAVPVRDHVDLQSLF